MITGITSTFLAAKKENLANKLLFLEIDEASLPKITTYLKPSLLFILIF